MKKGLFLLIFLIVVLTIYAEWTIVQTFPIPEGASGLAFDGTYLYCGIYGVDGNHVYQIDPADGSSQLLFVDPALDDTYGMTYDGSHLWLSDHRNGASTPAVAYKYDMNGNILSEFNLPDHYMSGIAYDNGDFWVSTYYPDPGTIYKVNNTGAIIQQFTPPNNQPWDLCLENGNLWMADYWGDALYKIDPTTGALLETHPSEGVDPAGIVWDGQYMWYCDNGQGYDVDFLYKVDLGGMGYLEGTITLDGGSGNVNGITVQIGTLTLIVDENGFFSGVVPAGTYNIIINIPNYEIVTFNDIVIIADETTVLDIILNYYFPPQNLNYTYTGGILTIEWEIPNTPLTILGWKVYRDGEELAVIDDPDITTYAVQGLYPGIYEFGFSTLYNNAESEFVNIQVEITDANNTLPPLTTKLHGNHPNPFNPSTTIRFDLANKSDIHLSIYNLKGQLVKTLIQNELEVGRHSVDWKGKDNSEQSAASGMYFYKFKANDHLDIGKCILLK
jgi:streptogramin lyase